MVIFFFLFFLLHSLGRHQHNTTAIFFVQMIFFHMWVIRIHENSIRGLWHKEKYLTIFSCLSLVGPNIVQHATTSMVKNILQKIQKQMATEIIIIWNQFIYLLICENIPFTYFLFLKFHGSRLSLLLFQSKCDPHLTRKYFNSFFA